METKAERSHGGFIWDLSKQHFSWDLKAGSSWRGRSREGAAYREAPWVETGPEATLSSQRGRARRKHLEPAEYGTERRLVVVGPRGL